MAERCDTCLKRDPAAAAAALPWETQQGSGPERFFRTLGSGFRPLQTAPAFARPGLRAALSFFLLTAVPLTALSGIIPYTKTLLFGNSAVIVQGDPTSAEIAMDVGIAMATQLLALTVELIALGLPYLSLTHAYAPPERQHAATRVLLYRSWLSPLATLVVSLAYWLLPAGNEPESLPSFIEPFEFARVMLNLLLLSSLRATVRLACGVGPLMSYVIVGISFMVWAIAQMYWRLLPIF